MSGPFHTDLTSQADKTVLQSLDGSQSNVKGFELSLSVSNITKPSFHIVFHLEQWESSFCWKYFQTKRHESILHWQMGDVVSAVAMQTLQWMTTVIVLNTWNRCCLLEQQTWVCECKTGVESSLFFRVDVLFSPWFLDYFMLNHPCRRSHWLGRRLVILMKSHWLDASQDFFLVSS